MSSQPSSASSPSSAASMPPPGLHTPTRWGAARSMAKKPLLPAATLAWSVTCQSLGRDGDFPLHCARCGGRIVLTLPSLWAVDTASTVATRCPACGVGFSVTLCPPMAMRPSPVPQPPGGWLTAADAAAEPDGGPAVDADGGPAPLWTLAQWQALGVGLDLNPATVAAIPRSADELPHRRNSAGRRIYSRAEIEEAALTHQALTHQLGGKADG
jgi:hypothetical protein